MKKLLIVLLLSFYLTSCYNYSELRDVSFCFGFTIDYDEAKEYKYAFNIETETSKRTASKGEFESVIHEVKGDSFAHAHTNLSGTTTGLIDFTHCKVIFLSKELSSKDLKDLIFYLFYNPIISNNIVIVMSNEKTAKEILESKSITDTSSSFEIVSAINNPSSYYNYGFKKTLTDLYNDFYGETGNFLIPTANVVKSNEHLTASLKGGRVYNNFEFVKYLDDEELMCTLVLTRSIKTFIQNLDTEEKLISLYIDSFKRKSDIEYNNNKIDITYKLKLKISSSESYDEFKSIKESLSNLLKSQIEELFKKCQDEDIDVFLLKTHLYKYNYKLYKEKKDNFDIKDINFKVNIDMNIKQRGMLR